MYNAFSAFQHFDQGRGSHVYLRWLGGMPQPGLRPSLPRVTTHPSKKTNAAMVREQRRSRVHVDGLNSPWRAGRRRCGRGVWSTAPSEGTQYNEDWHDMFHPAALPGSANPRGAGRPAPICRHPQFAANASACRPLWARLADAGASPPLIAAGFGRHPCPKPELADTACHTQAQLCDRRKCGEGG